MPPAPASPSPTPPPSPERRIASTLPAAILLAFTGGSLDAFLYLNHGHVFAGAMTGNAVLCGLAILHKDTHNALQHFLPIVAFFLGVWLAEGMQTRLHHHDISIGLTCEALGLLLCSFLPARFPEIVFVPAISFLAAYQVASFRKVDDFAYNSTFLTGDLRTVVVGLYHASDPQQRRHSLLQARDLGSVVISFLAGAVAGAALSPHFANHTLWLPTLFLLIVLALTLSRTPSPQPNSTPS